MRHTDTYAGESKLEDHSAGSASVHGAPEAEGGC